MRIVVNHLTRMRQGYCCVAGIDVEAGTHVRPVLDFGQLGVELSQTRGGPFDIGAVVELGEVTPRPRAPEVEDHVFEPESAHAVQWLDEDTFWEHLEASAQSKLATIFGSELRATGRASGVVDPGKGHASLGCLSPNSAPELFTRPNYKAGKPDKIRLVLNDGQFNVEISVTDMRLYEADQTTPRMSVVDDVAEMLRRGTECIISVGLTREYAAGDETSPVHWLQANNLHLADDPLWQLS